MGKLYEAHARRAPKDAQAKVKDWLERRRREVEDAIRELSSHRDDAEAERARLEASARQIEDLAERFQVRIASLRQRLDALERQLG